MKLFDLSGKTAVITGSSKGIGKAIAEQMADHGANVVISSRKAGPCDEVAQAINAKHGEGRAIAVPANIASKEDLQRLVDETNAAFGQIDAGALARVLHDSGATALRVTPWRLILLEGAEMPGDSGFITAPGDPLLSSDACPGAPFCPASSVETRDLARALAPRVGGGLHVSGCAKGCARSRPAAMVLTGRNGRFDLIENGHAWDAPRRTGLSTQDILEEPSGTR